MKEKHTFSTPDGIADVLKNIRKEERILLVAHERPDGDSIGSLCALYCILNENGYNAEAVFPEEVPDMYKSFLTIPYRKGLTPEEVKEFSLLVFLDCSNQQRVSIDFLREGELPLPAVNIDHHPDNSSFGNWNYFNSKAAACCEVLFDLAKKAAFTISPQGATYLLLGLITDCGCFRYDNTAPSTLRAAAELVETGADRSLIIQKCYNAKPENLALLEGDLLCNHLKKSAGGSFAYVYLAPALLEKYGVDLRNTEQLIDCIRQLSSVKACAVLRKERSGFKVSLRSKYPEISVGRIARSLGGGGHEMAAGSSLCIDKEEDAVRLLLDAVNKEMM